MKQFVCISLLLLVGLAAGCGTARKSAQSERMVRNIIMNSPAWVPGNNNGEAARVRYLIPVNFVLPAGTVWELRSARQAKSQTI